VTSIDYFWKIRNSTADGQKAEPAMPVADLENDKSITKTKAPK